MHENLTNILCKSRKTYKLCIYVVVVTCKVQVNNSLQYNQFIAIIRFYDFFSFFFFCIRTHTHKSVKNNE